MIRFLFLVTILAAVALPFVEYASAFSLGNGPLRDGDGNDAAVGRSHTPPSELSRRALLGSCLASAAGVVLASASPAKSAAPTQTLDGRSGVAADIDPRALLIPSNAPVLTIPTATASANAGEPPPPVETTTTTTAWQESFSGFVSGAAVSSVKTLVKYPLDTATVRLQMPGASYVLPRDLPALFDGCFTGITAPLLSNIPAGAVFFAAKDATKSALRNSVGSSLPKWASTTIAVAAALPPYWALRNPSETIKTRMQAGAYTDAGDGREDYDDDDEPPSSAMAAFQRELEASSEGGGVRDLYRGYNENLVYGLPADVIKFVAYERFSRGRTDLSPAEGAAYGAASTAVAQLVTTPLDVVRNRIMAERPGDGGGEDAQQQSYLQRLASIAKEEGVEQLFAGTTPRLAKAVLSGAIQFATYELTKQKVAQMFLKR